tara:strand:- start:2930 stop:3091 length:162 start_codon:yes stop_codon:yes gene_type:complete
MEALIHFLKHLIGFCGESHPSIIVSGLAFFTGIGIWYKQVINYVRGKLWIMKK